jgi:hypothetical protein
LQCVREAVPAVFGISMADDTLPGGLPLKMPAASASRRVLHGRSQQPPKILGLYKISLSEAADRLVPQSLNCCVEIHYD